MNVSKIQLLAEAVQDMESGKSFYDKQQQGVGEYFWDSLLADIESLLIHAGVHARVFGYHRMLSRRFPYAIYYDGQRGGRQSDRHLARSPQSRMAGGAIH